MIEIKIKNKIIILILSISLFLILGIGTYSVVSLYSNLIESSHEKLMSDLNLGEAYINKMIVGEWRREGDFLYKGNVLINNNFKIVDEIAELTGDTVTIFLDDTRICTNVKLKNGSRAIGTKVSDIVYDAVVKRGEIFLGKANVVDTINQTAYKPIKNSNGEIIGIWYVGVPNTVYDDISRRFRNNIIIYSIIILIIFIVISRYISDNIVKPIKKLEESVNEVARGTLNTKIFVEGSCEIGSLVHAFNLMTIKLDSMMNEIFDISNEFETLFKSSLDAIIKFDEKHRVLDINKTFTDLFEYTLDEIKGKEVDFVVAKNSELNHAKEMTKQMFNGKKNVIKGVRFSKSGKKLILEIMGIPIVKNNVVVGGYSIYRDISKRVLYEKELERQNLVYESLFKNSYDAIVRFDKHRKVIEINQNFTNLFGYTIDEVVGENIDSMISYENFDSLNVLTNKLMNGVKVIVEGVRYAKDKTPKNVNIKGVPIIENDEIIGGFAIYTDISERKISEKKMKYMSFHDELTDLYNRRYFESELVRLIDEKAFPLTLIMADVNGLKLVNDAFGHEKGDEYLYRVSKILKSVSRKNEIVARLGGDEFVMLLPNTTHKNGKKIVNRIKAKCSKEKINFIKISISFGIGTMVEEEDYNDFFKRVEDNMYREKLIESPYIKNQMFESIIDSLYENSTREKEHSDLVSKYCEKIGKRLGLKDKELEDLILAGKLHDIGKIALDKEILNKEGSLTKDEHRELRKHPEIGYRILNAINEMGEIGEYILAHHEWWNGTGYPKKLKGEDIPLESRIIAVADAFSSMIGYRQYTDSLTVKEAISELRKKSGIQFDPKIVEVFIDELGKLV